MLWHPEKTYTVLEVNTIIRKSLDERFPDLVWVCGEIQDLRRESLKKHLYFSLIQKHHQEDKILARIRALIFENDLLYIQKRLGKEKARIGLRNDIEIRVLCKIDFYPRSGEVSLIIRDIDPVYTLGKFAQSRLRMVEELRQKGFLEINKRKELSPLPLNIGLITSYDSDAWHDFISELKNSGYGFKIFLFDAHMQGENLKRDIMEGINFFHSTEKVIDAVVITRGGGESADLSWFDDLELAQMVATSKLPILTAIGHEINLTLIDLVSHRYFKTPTAIAQFLVTSIKNFHENLLRCKEEITRKVPLSIKREMERILKSTLLLERNISSCLRVNRELLAEYKSACKSMHLKILEREKANIQRDYLYLKEKVSRIIKSHSRVFKDLGVRLKSLDPKNVLKRGFSITYGDGRVLKTTKGLNRYQEVRTLLYKGEIRSKITELA